MRPDIPVYLDNTSPNKLSFSTGTITFTPVGNQGGNVTFVSALVIGGGTITHSSLFAFSVAVTDGFPSPIDLISRTLVVKFKDEENNIGFGVAQIAGFCGTGAGSYNHVAGMSAMSATGVPPGAITTNTVSLATPGVFNPTIGYDFWQPVIGDAMAQVTPVEYPIITPSAPVTSAVGANSTARIDVYDCIFKQKCYAPMGWVGLHNPFGSKDAYYTDLVQVTLDINGAAWSK
jgi:hypothetical protein